MSKGKRPPNRTATRRDLGRALEAREWLPDVSPQDVLDRLRLRVDYLLEHFSRYYGPDDVVLIGQAMDVASTYSVGVELRRAADELEAARRLRDEALERARNARLARLDDRRRTGSPTAPDRFAPEIVQRIALQADRIDAAHQALDSLVAEARRQGVPWGDIGTVTGRGAEGARSRWGRRPGTS